MQISTYLFPFALVNKSKDFNIFGPFLRSVDSYVLKLSCLLFIFILFCIGISVCKKSK